MTSNILRRWLLFFEKEKNGTGATD